MEVAIRLKYLTEEGIKEFRSLLESTTRLVAGLRRAKRLQVVSTTARSTGVFLVAFYTLSHILG
jgi:hypothetical protein